MRVNLQWEIVCLRIGLRARNLSLLRGQLKLSLCGGIGTTPDLPPPRPLPLARHAARLESSQIGQALHWQLLNAYGTGAVAPY